MGAPVGALRWVDRSQPIADRPPAREPFALWPLWPPFAPLAMKTFSAVLFKGTPSPRRAVRPGRASGMVQVTEGVIDKRESRSRVTSGRDWTRAGGPTLPAGRRKGSEVHAAKLTEADIPVIRTRRQAGETHTIIGRSYDVSYNAILGSGHRSFMGARTTWSTTCPCPR
jgi:hypothetical protein